MPGMLHNIRVCYMCGQDLPDMPALFLGCMACEYTLGKSLLPMLDHTYLKNCCLDSTD